MKFDNTLTLLAMLCLPFFMSGQPPGQPDDSFGQMGEVAIPVPGDFGYSGGTLILPDGKMIVAWQSTNISETTLRLTRLLPNGSIDATFGNQGTATPDLDMGEAGTFHEMAVTADHKIIGVGIFDDNIVQKPFVARFTETGELDASFGINGVTLIDEAGQNGEFNSVYILPSGKILAGGSLYDSVNSGLFDILLVQMNPDGQLDPSFGDGGIVKSDFVAGLEGILGIAVQADGKIVTVGGLVENSYDMMVARYNPDGTYDSSFGNNGFLQIGTSIVTEIAFDVALVNDKILFCGFSITDGTVQGQMTLFRLNGDGSFDASFGNGGKVLKEIGAIPFGRKLVVQNDGKVLVSGESTSNITSSDGFLWICRFNADGTTDETFGDAGGIAQTTTYSEGVEGIGLFLQPDNKIVATGFGTGQVVVWRFLNDTSVNAGYAEKPYLNFTVYPNPTQGFLQIEWALDKQATVSCELVDGQGRTIQSLIKKSDYLAGAHQLAFQLNENIPSHIAFLKLNIDGRITTLPIIFTR